MRRLSHHASLARHQRRALGGIDDLDRLARLAQEEGVILVAVRHDGALALRNLLRRLGRGLDLHHALLGELLEILPAQRPHEVERGREDGAAVGRVRLDDAHPPLRQQQVGIAARGVLRLHLAGVVGDHAEVGAHGGEEAVRVALLLRPVLRHVGRHIRREPAAALPVHEARDVRAFQHVGVVDAAAVFLHDALQDALGPGPFDPEPDAGVVGVERGRDLLGHGDVHGRVERDRALLLGGVHLGGWRRLRPARAGPRQTNQAAQDGSPAS